MASCALVQMVCLWMGGFSVALFWMSSIDSEKIREAGSHVDVRKYVPVDGSERRKGRSCEWPLQVMDGSVSFRH